MVVVISPMLVLIVLLATANANGSVIIIHGKMIIVINGHNASDYLEN